MGFATRGRECHGFTNPYGLRSRVGTGMGTGWHFRTPVKPAPVTWVSRVLLGYENINKQPLSFSTTTTIHLNHPPPLRHHCHQQSRSTTAHANDTSHDATATRQAPAGLTPHRGDDVARQRYPPDVPWSLTVATHAVDAIRSSNHDNDNGWEVGEERVRPEGQQPPCQLTKPQPAPVAYTNHCHITQLHTLFRWHERPQQQMMTHDNDTRRRRHCSESPLSHLFPC